MNSEELKLIKEMMDDAKNQSSLYTAGNYWKYYEKNILKQINCPQQEKTDIYNHLNLLQV